MSYFVIFRMRYPQWVLIMLKYEFELDFVNASDVNHSGYGEYVEFELEYQDWLRWASPPLTNKDAEPGHSFSCDPEDDWVRFRDYCLIKLVNSEYRPGRCEFFGYRGILRPT